MNLYHLKKVYLTLFIVVAFFMVFCISDGVMALSIGTSPGVLNYENVLRNGYAERTFTVSTSSPDELFAYWEIIGNYSDWITIEPADERFNFSRSNPRRLKVIITPPDDVGNQVYSTFLRVATEELGRPQGTVGSAVRTAVMIKINIGITGVEIVDLTVGGVTIHDAETGYPLQLSATIHNTGNVRLAPSFAIDIWDQLQENLVFSYEFDGPEILPTVKDSFTHEIPVNLEPGQYWAFVRVEPGGYSTLLTFDVGEKGEIIDKGALVSVSGKVWAEVNETVPIVAVFRNDGSRFVNARFKATVQLDNRIVELLESDEIRVEPQESEQLEVFFTPRTPGQFEVSGKVLYNKKLTFERGTIINVNPRPKILKLFRINYIPLVLYIIVFSIILFLIFKIRKLRKEKH